MTLAEFEILSNEKVVLAKVAVHATILRPIFCPTEKHNVELQDQQDVFKIVIPLEVDPRIELADIQITPSSTTFESKVYRKSDGDSQCEIVVTGKREEAIDTRQFWIDVSFKNEDWDLKDSIEVYFYDRTKFRILPSFPTASGNTLEFYLVGAKGMNEMDLKVEDGKKQLEFSVSKVSSNVRRIHTKLLDGSSRTLQVHIGDSVLNVSFIKQ